jgi:hypothetical protein
VSDSYYDVAQICVNGHAINTMAKDYPQSNQKFCAKCGEPTVMACPSCSTSIRGYYHVRGVFASSKFHAPSYCLNCGKPFPWTATRLKAAEELADELDGLTSEEKEKLKASLPELLRDGPNTVVAETRFKNLVKKAGSEAYDGMKAILVDVLSEAVKKSVFGS